MSQHLNNVLPVRTMSGRRSKPSIDLLVDSQRILSPYTVTKTVKTHADNISVSNHSERSVITAKRKPGPKCQKRTIAKANIVKKCPPVSTTKNVMTVTKVNGAQKIMEDKKIVLDQPTVLSQAPYVTLKLKKIDFIETLGLTKKVIDTDDEEIEGERMRKEDEKERCLSTEDKTVKGLIEGDKLRRDITNEKKKIGDVTKDIKKKIMPKENIKEKNIMKEKIKRKALRKETLREEVIINENIVRKDITNEDINEKDITNENKDILKNGEREKVTEKHMDDSSITKREKKDYITIKEDSKGDNTKKKDKENSIKVVRKEYKYTGDNSITEDKKLKNSTKDDQEETNTYDDDDDLPLSKAFPDFKPQAEALKVEMGSVLTPKKKKMKSISTAVLNGGTKPARDQSSAEMQSAKSELGSVGRIAKKRPLNGTREPASQSSPRKAPDDLSVVITAARPHESVSELPAPHSGGPLRETPKRCVRSTCTNVAIEDCRWDSEFCSPDCAVLHGKSLISEWIFQRRESTSMRL